MKLSEVVAGNIRAEAARRGWSQKKIATDLNMSTSAICQRWNGPMEWKLDEVSNLAELFGVDVINLFKDQAHPNESN